MKNILLFFTLFGAVLAHGQDCFHTDLRWRAALREAKAEDKVIFLDFYAPWCMPCKRMDLYTYPDEDVQQITCNDDVISIKINMGSQNGTGAHPDAQYLAQAYHVTQYPTMIFVDSDGTEVFRTTGFKRPNEFIQWFVEELEKLDD